MKKNSFFISLFAPVLIGCVSLPKYPSSWPARAKVTNVSQLSGIYHPGLLKFIGYSIGEGLYTSDNTDMRVQLLLNDSMQYEINWVSVSTKESSNIAMVEPKKIGSAYVKKKFCMGKGLKLSYHPDVGGQGTPLGVLRNYVILGKDKQDNLIIRNGQQVFGMVWLFFPVIVLKYEWISVGRDYIKYSSRRLKYLYIE